MVIVVVVEDHHLMLDEVMMDNKILIVTSLSTLIVEDIDILGKVVGTYMVSQ